VQVAAVIECILNQNAASPFAAGPPVHSQAKKKGFKVQKGISSILLILLKSCSPCLVSLQDKVPPSTLFDTNDEFYSKVSSHLMDIHSIIP
jgi:hypothetical protein